MAKCFQCRENNNTGSVCILVWQFTLFSIEHSMVSSKTKHRTHTDYGIDINITKEISTPEIISGPHPSALLLLWHSHLAASSGVIHQW